MSTRNFSNQLSGQMGEALVVAELGRLGVIATAFSGNVPDIDILAYKDARTTAIQVKAWKSGSVSFDARRFLEIEIADNKQTVIGVHKGLQRLPIYVFVKLGESRSMDEFYVLDQQTLARLISDGYQSFLDLHGGVRPKNPLTTHNSVTISQLLPHKNSWDTLLAEL